MILVDTDVLISHLRGVQEATDWLFRSRVDSGPLATSVITISEITGGMRSSERPDVNRLLSSLQIFPVTERIGWKAGEFMRAHRRSHPGVGITDYLIAATAEIEGLELATLNIRHFPMFPGLTAPFQASRPTRGTES